MQNQLKKRRFTLIEMMVAMGVFMILLTLLLNFFSGTRQVWKTLRDRNDSFEKARVAMDIVTDLLTTSVADEGNVGFWVPTTNDSCTFVTRTTRNLSSAAASGDDLSKELDNYYLAKIYVENGVLKLVGQRMGNSFTVSLDTTTAPVPAGTAKNIIDAVREITFKTLVGGSSSERCTALEVTLSIFDNKDNYEKYLDMADGDTKNSFRAAHEYVFTRVISFDDVTDPIYEVTNEISSQN